MTDALALAGRDLALELHALLRDLDPARFRAELERALHERVEDLEAHLTQLLAAFQARIDRIEQLWTESKSIDARTQELRARLEQRLLEIGRILDEYRPARGLSGADLRTEWEAFRTRLQPAYEDLAAALRAGHVIVPSLRPTNYKRSLLHLSSALVAIVFIEHLFSMPALMVIAAAWFLLAWNLEFWRRRKPAFNDFLMRNLGVVAHPHETNRVNSATWYTCALLALTFTQSAWMALVGVVVLGVGDPLAGLIGRRWGRTKLVNNRSLEGSTAFAVGAALATFAALRIYHPELGLAATLVLAPVAAVAGAFAELHSSTLDDNLTIPLASAAAAGLTEMLLIALA